MPGETLSTLDKIRTKIRRLSKSPSESQLQTSEIDNYINTFMLYDFPQALKNTYLRSTFSFFTSPNVDTYQSTSTNPLDQFYNFNNKFEVVMAPMYCAGRPLVFTQAREQFYGIFPQTTQIGPIPVKGNGVLTRFTGTLSYFPVLANMVSFVSKDVNNDSLIAKDDGAGNLVRLDGTALPNTTGTTNTIDYLTGAYDFEYPAAPANLADVNFQVYTYNAAWPRAVLFYDSKFIVRPVPDSSYQLTMEVYRRPLELLNSSQEPELANWFQYIAYGAVKKIFEDRSDYESVQAIMPEFAKQEEFINNRIAAQQLDTQVATIYNSGIGMGLNNMWPNGIGF